MGHEDQTVQIYEREDGLWDWRLVNNGNHEIQATSGGQGFTERNDAAEAAEAIFPDHTIQFPIR